MLSDSIFEATEAIWDVVAAYPFADEYKDDIMAAIKILFRLVDQLDHMKGDELSDDIVAAYLQKEWIKRSADSGKINWRHPPIASHLDDRIRSLFFEELKLAIDSIWEAAVHYDYSDDFKDELLEAIRKLYVIIGCCDDVEHEWNMRMENVPEDSWRY